MRALRAAFLVRGLGLERLLDALRGQEIPLYDVQREGPRRLSFSCPLAQAALAQSTAERLGFTLRPLPPRGALRALLGLRRRLPLAAAGLACAVLLAFALQYVWRIEIHGAGAYAGEVRALLREEGVAPGLFRAAVDTRALCEALLDRLPRVAWVRARVSGVTLVIEVTQGVPAPAVESAEGPGDIVAARDCVIRHIDVYAGTADARPGDTVRKGQVLIRGEERSGPDGATAAVRARGRVVADAWTQASAALSATETRSVPTGQITAQTRICSPWGSLALSPAPAYLTSDTEITRLPLGGAWLPLWIETVVYHEVALEEGTRDLTALQSEAGALALQKLLVLCGGSDEMIDNRLDFSMIEGDTIIATATAQLRGEVGVFVPHSSP